MSNDKKCYVEIQIDLQEIDFEELKDYVLEHGGLVDMLAELDINEVAKLFDDKYRFNIKELIKALKEIE